MTGVAMEEVVMEEVEAGEVLGEVVGSGEEEEDAEEVDTDDIKWWARRGSDERQKEADTDEIKISIYPFMAFGGRKEDGVTTLWKDRKHKASQR